VPVSAQAKVMAQEVSVLVSEMAQAQATQRTYP